MNERIMEALANSIIGQGLTQEQVLKVLASKVTQVATYSKNDIIFHEGDLPNKLYLMVTGKITIANDTVSGKRIVITQISEPGDLFGEVYAFMRKKEYDMYAVATERTVILEISTSIFTLDDDESLCQINERIMQNILELFANKAYTMSNKIKILGSGSVRQKIVRYLLQLNNQYNLMNREEMADWLNVTRPSLSRELGKMQEEGLVKIKGRNILIMDQEGIEKYI